MIASCLAVVGSCGSSLPRTSPSSLPGAEIAERSLAELRDDLAAGKTTSVALVEAYLARIEALDHRGPSLHAMISINPQARAEAERLDRERKAGTLRGPLHGIPIVLKDNIESRELPTTAGALALEHNRTERDAPVVGRLRAAGAIILGKTNMSEWANMRSSYSVSGWSALGGLVRNPYARDRSACGSSSGSAVAVAAGYAAAALGTETDGSVTCPAAFNALVGLKPTVGLVSRAHIVPISHSQDTAGPLTRTVTDTAILLTAMAGSDPADAATVNADAHKRDYAADLRTATVKGTRIGVARFLAGFHEGTDAAFERALAELRAAGAELVEIPTFEMGDIGNGELAVLLAEFKVNLDAYLASAARTVTTRTLADVIAFQRKHADRELRIFGQDLFEKAQATKGLDDPAYQKSLADNRRLAGRDGIDRLLREHGVVALVAPSFSPAFTIDLVTGDHFLGGSSMLPAVAGYPHLTVPMGQVHGLPVGLSFIGPAWSESTLLSLGYAFEQRTHARTPPTFAASASLAP